MPRLFKLIKSKRKVLFLAFDKIVKIPLGYLTLILTAKFYSLEDISEYAFASSLFFLLQPFSDFGINQYLAKPKYSKLKEYNDIVITSVIIKLLLSLAFCAFALIISLFLESSIIRVVFISLSVFNVFQSFSLGIRQYLLDQKKYLLINISDSLFTWPNLAIKMLTIVGHWPITFLAFSQVFSSIFQAIPLALRLSKNSIDLTIQKFKQCSGNILRLSKTYFYSSLVVIVYVKSDQLLLSWIKGVDSLGSYALAVQVVEASMVLMPVITSYYAGRLDFTKSNTLCDFHVNMNRSLLFYSLTATAFVIAFAVILVPPLFGDKYQYLCELLVILAPCIILTAILSSLILQVQYREDPFSIFWANFYAALVNLVLSLIMINAYGSIGASISTLLASFVPITYLFSLNRNINQKFTALSFPLKLRA